jgi:type III pantothenate kinase
MTILYFDLGNTRAKFWWCDGEEVIARLSVAHGGSIYTAFTPLSEAQGGLSIKEVCGVSVLAEEEQQRFIEFCRERWSVAPQFAKSTAHCHGVSSAYKERPESLGTDRWLGVIAAHSAQNDRAIVSCGSAITIDVVTTDGQHQGGYILPGLTMAAEALIKGTGRVRFEALPERGTALGTTTAEAVSHGVLASVAALVNQLATDKNLELVLTGGDALQVLPHITQSKHHEPELLLYGLQRYFQDAGIKTV